MARWKFEEGKEEKGPKRAGNAENTDKLLCLLFFFFYVHWIVEFSGRERRLSIIYKERKSKDEDDEEISQNISLFLSFDSYFFILFFFFQTLSTVCRFCHIAFCGIDAFFFLAFHFSFLYTSDVAQHQFYLHQKKKKDFFYFYPVFFFFCSFCSSFTLIDVDWKTDVICRTEPKVDDQKKIFFDEYSFSVMLEEKKVRIQIVKDNFFLLLFDGN